jgi:hypothetical protein
MKLRIRLLLCSSLALLAILSINPAAAATITVTNTNDNGPGSLRDAIASASPGDTIDFSLPIPETITIDGPLAIFNSLTISGPGPSNLLITATNVGVFQIGPFTPGVTISGLTIQGGGISALPLYGGGIRNEGETTIENCTVSGNAAAWGGGIYNHGTMTIINSTIFGNSAAEYGGGILNQGAMTVVDSFISSNGAGFFGGGIDNESTLFLTNSTVFGNIIGPRGGGGGAIFTTGYTSLSNTTIYENCAGGFSGSSCNSVGIGGAIFHHSGRLEVKNSILANNGPSGNCAFLGTLPIPMSYGHNLSDDHTCYFFTAVGDALGVPPGLDPAGPLFNGGPTRTIALLSGSPAIDAIPVAPTNDCTAIDGTPILTDQRGVARPQGVGCDIGAFEVTIGDLIAVESLTRIVLEMEIAKGTQQRLTGRLDAVADSLDRGDDNRARIELQAFLAEVRVFSLSGRLTYLEAAPLASSAAWVLRSIPFRCRERDDDAHRGDESRAGCEDGLRLEKLDLRPQVAGR